MDNRECAEKHVVWRVRKDPLRRIMQSRDKQEVVGSTWNGHMEQVCHHIETNFTLITTLMYRVSQKWSGNDISLFQCKCLFPPTESNVIKLYNLQQIRKGKDTQNLTLIQRLLDFGYISFNLARFPSHSYNQHKLEYLLFKISLSTSF